jgi:hypothetical protein
VRLTSILNLQVSPDHLLFSCHSSVVRPRRWFLAYHSLLRTVAELAAATGWYAQTSLPLNHLTSQRYSLDICSRPPPQRSLRPLRKRRIILKL